MGSTPSGASGATPTNIQTVLGPQTGGIPANAANQSALTASLPGGSALQNFLATQNVSSNFTSYMGNAASWIEDTMEGSTIPIYFAVQEGANGNRIQALIQSQAAPGVGGTSPSPPSSNSGDSQSGFEWNGQNYNIAGSITMTISYNETPQWYFTAPILVAETYPMILLTGNIWQGLLKPILIGVRNGIVSMINSLTGGGSSSVAEAAAEGGEQMAQDGVEIAGSDTTVTMLSGAASLLGVGALLGIPFLIDALGHSCTHVLQVYNLTDYDLYWSVPTTPHGAMNESPTMASGSSQSNPLIPAMSSYVPIQGAQPVNTYNTGTFAFASQSSYTGIAYVMQCQFCEAGTQTVVDTITVMFDLPFTGNNSVSLTDQVQSDPEGWYSSQEGVNQVLSITINGTAVTATANYNALSGQCENPSTGQNGYFYNSQLVFTPYPAAS